MDTASPAALPGLRGLIAARAKLLTIAAFVLAGIVLAAVVVASWRRAPDLGGLLTGLFTGLFLALLTLLALLWGLVSLTQGKRDPEPVDTQLFSELDALLAPTIRDLETIRGETRRKILRRAMLRVPLAIMGGLLAWLVMQFEAKPPGTADLFVILVVAGLAGQVWAASKLSQTYRQLYKQRVLPQLAARFGALVYRQAQTFSVTTLQRHRIFKDFDSIVAEDEIAGRYRGLPLSIVELTLSHGSGQDRQAVFDGLLVEIGVPRSLSGTTAVLARHDLIGTLKDRFARGTLRSVRLEDPAFEQHYQVYGSDQIQARALLTPAFMQRLLALGASMRFGLPGMLAEGNRLLVALPKQSQGNLFEPPNYLSPAGGAALLGLTKDIASVLQVADAVIALDFFARDLTAPDLPASDVPSLR